MLAKKLIVDPAIPRSASRQMHRNNVPAENPEQYLQRALALSLIKRKLFFTLYPRKIYESSLIFS